jgi:hypothetical protein
VKEEKPADSRFSMRDNPDFFVNKYSEEYYDIPTSRGNSCKKNRKWIGIVNKNSKDLSKSRNQSISDKLFMEYFQ